MATVADRIAKIQTFFQIVFGQNRGYVCLAKIDRPNKDFNEEFFQYPDELHTMASWISANTLQHDVYFCPQILREKRRTKASVDLCTCAWADLDSCVPQKLLVPPTIVIESSPKRYQALWIFASPQDPVLAEDVSRRIAYHHASDGVDRSGWDLTQLLRVPFTLNHKYANEPPVEVIGTNQADMDIKVLLEVYEPVKQFADLDIPFPTVGELGGLDAEVLMKEFNKRLQPQAWRYYQEQPDTHSWSEVLWQLEMMLFEAGMTIIQTYVVAANAACNKYMRDGRPTQMLWKEVCRAFRSFEERHKIVISAEVAQFPLISDQERKDAEATHTIVEEYIEWAKTLGDAAWQYHQAGAFVVLSSLLAGPVRLPTSFGLVVPNLWFMILADTTLTRKTTAMDISIDLLSDISRDVILATDGSIEGLFTSLSMRPGKPSVFLRDEFSGLLEAMVKKDYYAGMGETLTKLYDGKFQKRVLRKEIIEVRDPVLIIFAGGIKSRVMSLLDHQHVASGFLPRFVFITAESDVSRLRPLGPPTSQTTGHRQSLLMKLNEIHSHYLTKTSVTVDKKTIAMDKIWDAQLTADAWLRYNTFESAMLEYGLASNNSELMTPTMDRLAKSTLKTALLIAATRHLDDKVVVNEVDIVKAIAYCEHWREYAVEVVSNVGTSTYERQIQVVYDSVKRKPGILRSQLMQMYHLKSRDADMIFETLDQRGMLTRIKTGKTERLFAINE